MEYLLYFPNIKISRVDLIPGSLNYLLYLKSLKNSPKHYPSHPLIEGKIEFTYKLVYTEFSYQFILKTFYLNKPNQLKSKNLSCLIQFNENDNQQKFKLVGIGKMDDFAMPLPNSFVSEPLANKSFLEYDIVVSKKQIKKREKI